MKCQFKRKSDEAIFVELARGKTSLTFEMFKQRSFNSDSIDPRVANKVAMVVDLHQAKATTLLFQLIRPEGPRRFLHHT